MEIIGFKIWYTDGSMQSSPDWRKLPSDDMLIVMVYYDEFYEGEKRYRLTCDGCDWYWFDGTTIQSIRSTDEVGSRQPKPEGVDDLDLKKGEQVSDEEFKRISEEAMKDVEFDG